VVKAKKITFYGFFKGKRLVIIEETEACLEIIGRLFDFFTGFNVF